MKWMKKALLMVLVLMVGTVLLTGCQSEAEKKQEQADKATKEFFQRTEK